MPLTSGEMLAVIQKYRDQITADVDTALDGATVASFLLLTFAMDLTDHQLNEQCKEFCEKTATAAYEEAQRIGFGFTPKQNG